MASESQSSMPLAVLNCWTAYQQTFAIERGKGANENAAYEQGKMAYRQAMPCLTDQPSIRDFLACVTHGMVLGLIPNHDGGKLLYAANVLSGFLRQEQAMAQKMIEQSPQASPQKVTKQSPQNAAPTEIGSPQSSAA